MKHEKKVAIVTGAGQGIGQIISYRLAQEGAFVVATDIGEENINKTVHHIEKQYGKNAKGVVADITSEDQVERLIKSASDVTGKIEILVNNAGIAGPIDYIENIDLKGWNETIGVNLSGMFLCCKYTVPIMKNQKGGAIVNIASITGKYPLPQRVPYATTKMGVIGFTRTLAAEIGSYKIRVNAICPGSVTGDRQKLVFEGIAKYSGKSYEEVVEERLKTTPLRSLIDPKHVASVVSFLCSDDAVMMTGQDINVTGGRIMY
jgi:NAD(P)-dependent dehydrogenase (short-subunit alcohol dehydrogenase family)